MENYYKKQPLSEKSPIPKEFEKQMKKFKNFSEFDKLREDAMKMIQKEKLKN